MKVERDVDLEIENLRRHAAGCPYFESEWWCMCAKTTPHDKDCPYGEPDLDRGHYDSALSIDPVSAWERCPRCSGSGLSDQGAWIGDCSECDGEGVVRVRDARGRFVRQATQEQPS